MPVKKRKRWEEFKEQIATVSPEGWECFAPRSDFAARRERMIYKLFIRVKSSPNKWWWYFEERVGKVPPEYPEISYPDWNKNAAGFVQGAMDQLRDVEAENEEKKSALKRALRLIHTRLTSKQ